MTPARFTAPLFVCVLLSAMACPEAPEDNSHIGTPVETEFVEPSFPQALNGALWANPDLYAVVPFRILATSGSYIEVLFNEEVILANEIDDSTFVAALPIGEIQDGVYPITVTVNGETLDSQPSLHTGRQGQQITNWDEVGSAQTPRLHVVDGKLFLTWADNRESPRRTWLQEINGAGQLQGTPVPLTPADKDVVYGRAAIGEGTVAVLYQEDGAPYINWLRVTDLNGEEVIAPIDLDNGSGISRWGGDLSYNGESFVAVWRNSTGGNEAFSEVRWLKATPSTGAITGPTVIATSGDENPIGGFLPITFVHAETIGDVTLATFTRDLYDELLEMTIARNYAVMVDGEGGVLQEGMLEDQFNFGFGFETKVHQIKGSFVPLWTVADLMHDDTNQPHQIYGSIVDPSTTANPSDYLLTEVLIDSEARSQMTLVEHPEHFAVMAWVDERSRAQDIATGRYEMFFTILDNELQPGEERKIDHGVFVVDGSQVNGQTLGPNVVLVWCDERKGGGSVLNSKPEIFMETLWY
ncbi:MAG: hypothetical protein CMH56_16920 [Myxococcales bacterium]|nr:hypothetical protein [Myxococcales bacterium]